MNNKFKLADISQETVKLLKDAEIFLESSHNDKVRELAHEVPAGFTEEDKPLSIVFAGQYSAGKSSILSLLTGVQQKVGEGITTGELSTLDWNGIKVIDTPGIHTELHPDHDRITYDAISKADLIVFVLTNEGFSNHLGKHFRRLVNDMGKGYEMMLVMNKMDNEALGNTPEAQSIKSEDINKVLSPSFTVDDMYMSFISADLYRQSLDVDDPALREDMLAESGWDNFIKNLNRFEKDKHLTGKFTTNLYRLEQIIYDAMSMYKTDDPETDATIELLNRNRRALVESREKIKKRVEQEIQKGDTEIIGLGDTMALALTSDDKPEEFNDELQKAYVQTDEISDFVLSKIEKIITEESAQLGVAMQLVMDSQLAQDLKTKFQEEIIRKNISPEMLRNAGEGAKYAKDISKWIAKIVNTPGVKTGWKEFFKINKSGSSYAQKAVMDISKFFGHKIQPWKAGKIASRIGKAGKIIGVAGSVAGVAFQIMDDRKEKEKEQHLLEARAGIRNSFREVAHVMDDELERQSQHWVESEINTMIAEIDASIAEFEQIRETDNLEYQELDNLLHRVQSLISEIQKENS